MDIIGFDEQIGFIKTIAKKITAMPQIIKKSVAMPQMIKKSVVTTKANNIFSNVKKTIDQAKAKGILPKITIPAANRLTNVKKTIDQAKAKGIITNPLMQRNVMVQKAMTQGKKPFNLVPTANSIKQAAIVKNIAPVIKKDEVSTFQKTLNAMPSGQEAQAIFNLPPTPAIVKNLDGVQRSFLKTDLPYQVISPNNYGQPTTKFIKYTPLKFNIDIDQIQPPVDGGMSNYYGK